MTTATLMQECVREGIPAHIERQPRALAIDALRGLAVLLVLGAHPVIHARDAGSLKPLAAAWHTLGDAGIDLAFVLSGFLIGGLLLNAGFANGPLNIRRFLTRRAFRILPVYFCYLLFAAVTMLPGRPGGALHRFGLLLPNVFGVQNYLGTPFPHTWPIAVETHFYLLLPLVLLFLTRRRGFSAGAPTLPWFVVGLAVVCAAARWLTVRHHPFVILGGFVWPSAQIPTHLRLDSLFWGVLLAYWYHVTPAPLHAFVRRHRVALWVGGAALILPLVKLPMDEAPWAAPFLFPLLSLGWGGILLASVVPFAPGRAPSGGWGAVPVRVAAAFGIVGYPIYLWHVALAQKPLMMLLHEGWLRGWSPEGRWIAAMLTYALLAAAAGALVSLLVERPALMLRDRWFPSSVRAMDTTVSRPGTPSVITGGGELGGVILLTDSDVFAGTERHMLDLARGLRAEHIPVYLAGPAVSVLCEKAAAEELAFLPVEKGPLLDWAAVFVLRRVLCAGRIDIIHAHNGRTALSAALAIVLAGRGRCISTHHFLDPAHGGLHGLKALGYRRVHLWVNRRTAHVIAISEAVQQATLARGEVPPSKITVVPNGISVPDSAALQSASSVREGAGVPAEAPLIVCVARLELEKDVASLVAAMPAVLTACPNTHCLIAGDGSQRGRIADRITALGLSERVSLLGYCSDTLSLIAAADVFVLPSLAEPFGLVILEAMALGKPVVTTRAGGPREIVRPDETGLLVPPGQPSALADALSGLLADPERCWKMGRWGRRRFLDCYTVERMTRDTLAIYREASRRNSSRG